MSKTIEEKAKAYDEALDRARVYWETDDNNTLDIKARGTMEYLFPELAESEDEKIRKEILEVAETVVSRDGTLYGKKYNCREWIAWLEKQGKKQPFDYENVNIQPKDFATKVESKFKVGDWVVHDMSDGRKAIGQIVNITNKSYVLDGEGFNTFYFNDLENDYHLWTIQDAKDGDVLREDSCTFIIERMNPDGTAIVYCCLFDDGDFDSGSTLSFDIDSTKPATKEQCDFFFQKMKEKSYEWNVEKKELKKIKYRVCDEDKAEMDYCFTKMMNGEKVSPKDEEYNGEDYGIDSLYHAQRILEKTLGSVDGYQTDDGILSHKCAITAIKKLYKQKSKEWSKEDEKMFDYALDMIEWYSGKNGDKSKLVSDWLKSLKDRVLPKQKWSEEDEARLQSCLNILQAKGFMGITETINTKWLKSLKQRYTWKPSDEQLYILNWLATNVLEDGVVDKKASEILYTLYDDLKKLKG
jgi:hypothetical protein